MIGRVLAALGAGIVCAWLAGFLWFIAAAVRPQTGPVQADGIVVLTGGADRIAMGLDLLRAGRGRLLLISGVGKGADLPSLGRAAGIDVRLLGDRITLGRLATSTAGNAEETALWARNQGLRSLIVVTASYHIPRAMTELQRSLPDVRLTPAPVLPPALRGAGSVATVRLLAEEYTKWLAAKLGLSRLAADAEPG